MRTILVMALLSMAGVALAQIPAEIAAGRPIVPTFDELHRAYFRIAVHESGFLNLADQDGILQSLINCGGGRKADMRGSARRFGLSPTKLMRQMARHSKRTFPPSSKFLDLTSTQRLRFARRRSRQNKWVSTLQLDCSEPSGWPKRDSRGRPMIDWGAGFGKRCRKAVRTTRAFLEGRMKTFCDGRPTTWGSHEDAVRAGGPIDRGWKEIRCDRPPRKACGSMTRGELLNSTKCAQNRFWTWRERRKRKL